MRPVDRVRIEADGLVGDHRARPGKRAVTLMQWEHLPVVASLAGVEGTLAPERLRRNLLISGINLLALRDATFRCDGAVLRGTGICAPCSRMTEKLGPGGYNAVRGNGGILAEVVEPGKIGVGHDLVPLHECHGATAFPR